MAFSEHLVPLRRYDFGFFDRQRSLFSDMFKDSDDEFKKFDEELEQMRHDMFRLMPRDFNKPESSVLDVARPFITDPEGSKKLAIRFDVSQFKPEEITVKTVDKMLVVHGKHVEESPGRKISREFTKSYSLPPKVDPLQITSTLSKDGVLNIEGPAPPGVDAPRERILPIKQI